MTELGHTASKERVWSDFKALLLATMLYIPNFAEGEIRAGELRWLAQGYKAN